ncbi:MAG TPA: ABC transporter permease [Pseudonocardia sp.]|nr:ABC transporter permease [Pseudonocardia sp.]
MSSLVLGKVRSGVLGNVPTLCAVGVLVLLAVTAVFAPVLAPASPDAQDLLQRLRPPAWLPGSVPGSLLGTDELGRDVLSRLIYGTRVSLLVALAATVLSGVAGTALGLIAGYFGGKFDSLLMRLADVQLGIPSLLLALAIIAALGPGLWKLVVVLGLTGWVAYARVVRAEVLTLRTREFVVAAEAIGVRRPVIMMRHLLPNVVAPVATIATLQVATVIIVESSLSYLGLGVPPSTPTWGSTLAAGQLHLSTAWWIAVFPGLAIMVTTISINLVGDLLRDVSDPKTYLS